MHKGLMKMLISAPLPFTSGSDSKRTKKTHLQAQLAGALYEFPLFFLFASEI